MGGVGGEWVGGLDQGRERESSTQFSQQLASAVTAPPLVGCVVWSLLISYIHIIMIFNSLLC